VAPSLQIERSGRGAPLVFWHGWGMNLRVFDALRADLATDFLTQAVDLPGHGRSPWQAESAARVESRGEPLAALDTLLAPLLPTLPADSTLVGWSLGGQLALRAALLAPERVARLVLIATTPRFRRAPDWPYGVDDALLVQMRTRLASDYAGTLRDFLELQLRGSRDAVALLHALRAALRTQGEAVPAALLVGLDALAHSDLRSLLPQIHQPLLAVGGQYDRITPPQGVAALADRVTGGRYHQFARAAHAPFLSHAAEFAALLREFVTGAAAP
jgi:pimeloyl-[acyl-carrier protein] methyl ester esterase